MKQLLYLPLVFLFCISNTSFAQNPEWVTYDTSNSGLLSSDISCIAIDESNNKWIGFWDGSLEKFDGTIWTVYDTLNSDWKRPGNRIRSITVDKTNNLWMGNFRKNNNDYYAAGLKKFDGTVSTVYNTSNSDLPNNSVGSFAIDQYNNKWVGTYGGGLAKFDDTDWVVYNQSNSGLPDNNVYNIIIDNSGNKWMWDLIGPSLFDWGITKLHADNTTWTTFYPNFELGLDIQDIDDIAIDASDNVWILGREFNSEFILLIKFDGTDWTVYYDDTASTFGHASPSMKIDESGNIWIGTGYEGLKKFDGTSWTVYNESNSGLPANFIDFIAVDSLGNKWIGTYDALSVFNEGGVVSEIEEITIQEAIPKDYVLYQNYPNPFNPTTTIKYSIPAISELAYSESANSSQHPASSIQHQTSVSLKIYDILGKEVATLVNAEQRPGNYEVKWDASALTSGVYFYKLTAGDYTNVKKMVLLR